MKVIDLEAAVQCARDVTTAGVSLESWINYENPPLSRLAHAVLSLHEENKDLKAAVDHRGETIEKLKSEIGRLSAVIAKLDPRPQ